MFSSLGKIKNPFLRSITTASTSLAIVTLMSAVAIGLINPKDKSANQMGVYASLLAAFGGGVLGLAVKDKSTVGKVSPTSIHSEHNDTWKDWRDFEIFRKVQESKEITSFYFKPQDGIALPKYKPGQFLTIKLAIPEQPRPVIRTYSLSDYAFSGDYYRLSIKREGSPKGLNVPPGIASNFMHDLIAEGSVIPCKPPNGKFFLDVESSVPAVLISNGVGITPMISMVKACSRLNPNRHIWFIHGARNGEFHALRDEVNAIAENYDNLHIHYRYSRPRPEDLGKYHSQGYANKQLIEDSILPEISQIYGSSNAKFFLCGSPSFMDSIKDGLRELDVPEDNVYFESFGGGTTKGQSKTKATNQVAVEKAEVIFAKSGQTITWTKNDGTLLEFAEANNINPDYSCRQGVCLTCMCQLQEGAVKYLEQPASEPDEGSVLICISQPKTARVVLNL